MTAPAFVTALRARGAVLEVQGETLRVTPSNLLTDADRAAWKEHKREIIALLEPRNKSSNQSAATWKREKARSALDLLHEEAALCAVPFRPGLVRVTLRLCELWHAAEAETGELLTISGHPRASASLTSIQSDKTVNE